MMENKTERIKSLVDKLNKASEVYEQGTDEIMSNYEYDRLYNELEELEKETGLILEDSPTVNVGYRVKNELETEKHDKKLLSLDKTKERNSLIHWLNGKEAVLSWKLDGITVVITYENGVLTKAVTRGNGEYGELVTHNAEHFKNLPKRIAYKNKLVMRGEAIISYSNFNKINSSSDKYKNPRNLCSGSVRQLDSKIAAGRDIEWFAFEVIDCNKEDISDYNDKRLEWLESLGFDVVEHVVVDNSNILDVIEDFSCKVGNYDLPTDGLVLSFRSREYGESLGYTSKFPKHSIAFKWADEVAVTELTGIEWQVGRTGVVTPVAEFNPVELEGTTVTRASLHNLSILSELLGHPYKGQKIKVYKANMIIPSILGGDILDGIELEESEKLYIPNYCPHCGYELEVREEGSSGVLTVWCDNEYCGAKGLKKFKHFVSRDAMNIDGVSESTLDTFICEGFISDFASIFKLDRYVEDIVNLDGFGERKYENIISAVNKARDVKVENLIYALGISNIGLSTAKVICNNFNNDLDRIIGASYDDLITIDGIGEVIAESFTDYFYDEDNRNKFHELCKELNIIKEEVSRGTSMSGVTICVTGDVHIFSNRRAIKDLVENLGGKLTGSVSKSTSYLLTNDKSSGSNKNKSAQKFGIPILNEQEFIEKFNLQDKVK